MTDVGMGVPQSGQIPAWKEQPWMMYDTVASRDFRIGAVVDAGFPALGTSQPAFNQQGECVFFDAGGRNKANWPQLTNMDVPGQLSYGFRCHAVALELKFPMQILAQTMQTNASAPTGPSPAQKLAECIVQFGSLQMMLGQEEQFFFPVSSFSNGGALYTPTGIFSNAQNGFPAQNVLLALPKPILMGRTQNLSVKLKIAPQCFTLIGRGAAAGVGAPVDDYAFTTPDLVDPAVGVVTELPMPPYGITCKLYGAREKLAQYGAAA